MLIQKEYKQVNGTFAKADNKKAMEPMNVMGKDKQFDSSNYLQGGADAAMKIFDRVDKMKKPDEPAIHSAVLKNEKDIEYFLKKAEDIDNKYGKTVIHVYSPEKDLIANVSLKNLEDGTDTSKYGQDSNLSTIRNTLQGHVAGYGSVTANVLQAGVYYSKRENAAQVGKKIEEPKEKDTKKKDKK